MTKSYLLIFIRNNRIHCTASAVFVIRYTVFCLYVYSYIHIAFLSYLFFNSVNSSDVYFCISCKHAVIRRNSEPRAVFLSPDKNVCIIAVCFKPRLSVRYRILQACIRLIRLYCVIRVFTVDKISVESYIDTADSRQRANLYNFVNTKSFHYI